MPKTVKRGYELIPLRDASDHIGRFIAFLFYPGWEEPYLMTGWLHAVTPADDASVYVTVSHERAAPSDEPEQNRGGYRMWFPDRFASASEPSVSFDNVAADLRG